MHSVKRILILCSLLLSLNAEGQDFDSISSPKSQSNTRTLTERIRQVQNYLDAAARAKVDSHYIEVPAKPWRVILRYKENAVGVKYDNSIEFPATNEYSEWQMRFSPPMASSIGFWVGYRGTGISYSKSLVKNAGRYFSFSSTGAKYGLNFQLRRFSTDKTTITAADYQDGELLGEEEHEAQTYAPVWIRSVYINGYYVFSGRRYSQAAAYNQSVIQRRSAGSFLVGATWYQSSLDYSGGKNAGIMILSHNIGRIKLHQANIGVGYGYNFVPFRGFVINAMVMPTISIYNRVKVTKYDSNYELAEDQPTEDYGQWNPQTRTWANGKTHKPIPTDEEGNQWIETVDSWQIGSETDYGSLRFNVDLRLGIAYNWKNFFIGLQGQLNQFTYKKDKSKVSLLDGYARISLGVRL